MCLGMIGEKATGGIVLSLFSSGGDDGELGDFGLMLILGESRLLTMFEGRLELFLLMIVCERR